MTRQFLMSVCLLGFAAEVPAAEEYAPEIYASVYSTNSWKEHNFDEVGMYRFRADRYERELVMQDPYIDASGGGAMTDDFYFCTQEYNYGYWVDVTHHIVDPDDWSIITSLRDGYSNAVATDLSYDPTTAKVFGCFSGEGENMVFGTIDVSTGEVFKIADIEIPWIACSTDRNGNLYAIDMSGNLLLVDKVRGTTECAGALGFTATRRSTGAIDTRTGIFYVVVTNSRANEDPYIDYELNESHLYAVDLNTATATHLYEFEDGEAMGGMYIPGEAAHADAPAQVDDLVLDFPKGSLSGTMSFTVPATSFSGNAATGTVDYLMRANGSLLAQGTATVGERVSGPVSVDESALYKIELSLTNKAGRSPKTKTRLWIGVDKPKAMETPVLGYAGGSFTLSWKAPSESVNGGYFDPDKISYRIVRQPDNVTVADKYTGTSFSEPMAVPTGVVAYRYDVTMEYDGIAFTPVSSNVWRLGSAPIPYKASFEAENSLDDFTIIDADEDNIKWYREWDFYIEATDEVINVVSYPYSSSIAERNSDDWLLTPPFELDKGSMYRLGYAALTNYEGDEPRLAVYLGTSPTAEAMTTTLQAPIEIGALAPESHNIDFSVAENGIYYIGFHACSEPGKNAIALTTISLEADRSDTDGPTIAKDIAISKNDNIIRISSPAGITYRIYTADGRIARSGTTAEAETTIALSEGFYIVRAGSKTAKIVIR